jgi:hypothetical protein
MVGRARWDKYALLASRGYFQDPENPADLQSSRGTVYRSEMSSRGLLRPDDNWPFRAGQNPRKLDESVPIWRGGRVDLGGEMNLTSVHVQVQVLLIGDYKELWDLIPSSISLSSLIGSKS